MHCKYSKVVVLFQNYLVILNPLHFYTNFTISFPISTKKPSGILIETKFNLQINVERMDILIILLQTINMVSLSFYLVLLQFSQQFLQLLVCRSCICFVTITPKSFMVLEAIVNGIVLILFIVFLPIYKNIMVFVY